MEGTFYCVLEHRCTQNFYRSTKFRGKIWQCYDHTTLLILQSANIPVFCCFIKIYGLSCFYLTAVFWFCRYHSLVKLLKSLIHRTQCCQHLRLLDKHCVVPAFNINATGKSSTIFEVSIGAFVRFV